MKIDLSLIAKLKSKIATADVSAVAIDAAAVEKTVVSSLTPTPAVSTPTAGVGIFLDKPVATAGLTAKNGKIVKVSKPKTDVKKTGAV